MSMYGVFHSAGPALFLPAVCMMAGCQENGAVK